MRTVVTFAALALAAGLIVPKYAAQMHARGAPPTLMAAHPAETSAPADTNSVILPKSPDGHFHVDGRVDGRRLEFLVDTGASVIALNARDAASLGIHPSTSEYRALVNTANGQVRVAPVTLDRVEVGDLVVRDVPALVMPDDALRGNLLGMSFLSRLRHWEFTNGKLVLEQ